LLSTLLSQFAAGPGVVCSVRGGIVGISPHRGVAVLSKRHRVVVGTRREPGVGD
jgi:hypothetical protein